MKSLSDSITAVLKNRYGRDISAYDADFIIQTAEIRKIVVSVKDTAAYIARLEQNSEEAEIFYSSLQITYSQFFREPMAFALLCQRLIPDIISRKAAGGEIRVWSAGCSCGQEAYSVAILLDEQLETSARKLGVRVFGTDISPTVLNYAIEGIYDDESIQNVRLRHLQKYFVNSDGNYAVIPRLKEHVSFSHYDLLDRASSTPPESIYGDFDIIFCSNLLFYYKAEARKIIIDKLYKSLSATGYIVTGEAEQTAFQKDFKFRRFEGDAAIFYKSIGN